MAVRLVALMMLVLSACNDGPTTLLLELSSPAPLTSLDLTLSADGVNKTHHIDVASMKLPGTLIVQLPDRALVVTLDVIGHGPAGDFNAHAVVASQPHTQVKVPLIVGTELADLAGADLAGADLAGPPTGTDLAGAKTPPTPRHISTSYFTNYSGSTFAFPTGMTQTTYAIATTGVIDGDLLLVIANIDNGSNTVFPDPIAPGFHQLAEVFYGTDGQTYVVSWKIASGEPAMYSGTYGTGLGSGSAVLSLIAVAGANQTTPINAFLASQGSTSSMTVVATSAGVTTTVPNCTIVYAAGSDWLAHEGSNTFTLPAGYTSLVEIGDRGSSDWDWTSQMVAWKTQPAAGATGTITGTLTGTQPGIPWAAVIAIAP